MCIHSRDECRVFGYILGISVKQFRNERRVCEYIHELSIEYVDTFLEMNVYVDTFLN